MNEKFYTAKLSCLQIYDLKDKTRGMVLAKQITRHVDYHMRACSLNKCLHIVHH